MLGSVTFVENLLCGQVRVIDDYVSFILDCFWKSRRLLGRNDTSLLFKRFRIWAEEPSL